MLESYESEEESNIAGLRRKVPTAVGAHVSLLSAGDGIVHVEGLGGGVVA